MEWYNEKNFYTLQHTNSEQRIWIVVANKATSCAEGKTSVSILNEQRTVDELILILLTFYNHYKKL